MRADAARLAFAAGCFSAAACLTMLHHIPSVDQQNAALAEIARVLWAGGVLVGCDGLDTPERRRVHQGDIFVPVEPAALARRLRTAGFAEASVQVAGDGCALRPPPGPDGHRLGTSLGGTFAPGGRLAGGVRSSGDTAGETAAALVRARGAKTHGLEEVGRLTDTYGDTYYEYYGVWRWQNYSDPRPRFATRDGWYAGHVARHEALPPLEAALRWMSAQPELQ